MRGFWVGIVGMGMGVRGIWVGMWGIREGMRGIRVERGESGLVCKEYGENAGNLGGNAGNRIEVEKTKWKFIKSNFFAEFEKNTKLELS